MEGMMLMTAIRSAVSLVSLTLPLALGACARAASPVASNGATATSARPFAIRFENQAQTYVDVYFVGQLREWWLGRVSPGALVSLQIPDAAWLENEGYVRLAVLAGVPRSGQAARDPRSTMTIAQPTSSLLSQRWTFHQTQLQTPELFGQKADPR
jgi:hypothetical protein